MLESLDSLCKDGVRIFGRGNPERGVERRSIEEPGGSFRIHRPYCSLTIARTVEGRELTCRWGGSDLSAFKEE